MFQRNWNTTTNKLESMWEMKGDTPKQTCNMHTPSRKRDFQRTPNVLNDVWGIKIMLQLNDLDVIENISMCYNMSSLDAHNKHVFLDLSNLKNQDINHPKISWPFETWFQIANELY